MLRVTAAAATQNEVRTTRKEKKKVKRWRRTTMSNRMDDGRRHARTTTPQRRRNSGGGGPRRSDEVRFGDAENTMAYAPPTLTRTDNTKHWNYVHVVVVVVVCAQRHAVLLIWLAILFFDISFRTNFGRVIRRAHSPRLSPVDSEQNKNVRRPYSVGAVAGLKRASRGHSV